VGRKLHRFFFVIADPIEEARLDDIGLVP